MEEVLNVENLSKTYGDQLAISDINLSVAKGEVVGFLGPNGAGKSTSMRIICGVIPATTGEVTIAGVSLKKDPIIAKSHIGFLPEIPPLYLDMRVKDYLRYVAELKQVPSNLLKRYVSDSIEQTNLQEVQQRFIGHLSKGFKQRVGIAQALVSKPDLLVLDEPSVGLDPKQVIEIRQLIQSLSREQSVILSTHILSEVQAICERVIILNKGKIVAQDSIKSLNQKLGKGRELILRTHKPADKNLLQQIQGVVNVKELEERTYAIHVQGDVDESIVRFVLDQQLGFVELKPVELNLESIFLQLTGDI